MTTPLVDAAPAQEERSWSGWWRWIGIALLVGWVVVLASAVLVGERETSHVDLEKAIAAGDVSEIEVAGGLDKHGNGFTTVELRWRDGFVRRYAEVREVGRGAGRAEPPRVRAGYADRLAEAYPDLRVERVGDPELRGFEAGVVGYRLPGWSASALLVVTLGSLLLLICGPQPWRATKWAWFWITGLAAPLGQLAYLVVGGPTPLGRRPAAGTRRLAGGWAFLLALLVSAAFGVTFSII
jgi:hypothetical protein